MDKELFNQGLLDFIKSSPTPYHAVATMAKHFIKAGYKKLDEGKSWSLKKDQCYFVIRSGSLIAFRMAKSSPVDSGIFMAGAHTDSPCLKIKPTPEIRKNGYLQLGVEVYGGALLNPWFDRDLSIAGRIDYLDKNDSVQSCLLNLVEPVAVIPSLAIHLDREANKSRTVNSQKHLPPLLLQVQAAEEFSFNEYLTEHLINNAGVSDIQKILAYDLSLYDTQSPSLVGLKKEFIASARLDNLLSCYLCMHALLGATSNCCSLVVCTDHEEVGSASASGAQGPFLKSVLERICGSYSSNSEDFERVIRNSLLLSIDNAHGVHPNFADKHDDNHGPILNQGPCIKINANQRYASSSNSVAIFKALCEKAQVPVQTFVMRSDMACGSTIGPITASEVGVSTVDIGVPTFAMHSIRELAGSEDGWNLEKVVGRFFCG